jgi:hypothetical protein
VQEPSDQALHPLFDFPLFALRSRRLDVLLTAALVGVVILSRVAAFPASIWDQDEAYFSGAIIAFDPSVNHPHPPWFPLLIALGKIVHVFGIDPSRSVQLVSAAFSCWMLFPLASLWSGVVGRRLGVVAAVLFLFLPGSWLLAGRAYSGTVATALLAAALAFWIHRPEDRRWQSLGGVFAGLAILARPHFLLAAAAALAAARWRRPKGPRWRAWAALAAVLCAGAVGLVVASSGIEPLRKALMRHSLYHFGALPEASMAFSSSGLTRCLLSPAAGWVWVLLVGAGVWATFRKAGSRRTAIVVCAALAAILAVVIGFSDPVNARYYVPVLALSSGFVVAVLATFGRGVAYAGTAVVVAASVAITGPQLAAYRTARAPTLHAIEWAVDESPPGASVLVADHTLIAFVSLLNACRPDFPAVIYDNQIESGGVPPPPPRYSTAVFTPSHGGLIEAERSRRLFSCSVPVLRRLERDRFLDIVVSSQPVLTGWVDDGRPYILIDGD